MAVLIFALSILSILATVGILFAFMVRLASLPNAMGQLKKQTVQAERKP